MKCPKHNCKMIQLFSSWACDVCDGKSYEFTETHKDIFDDLIERLDKALGTGSYSAAPAGVNKKDPVKAISLIDGDLELDDK